MADLSLVSLKDLSEEIEKRTVSMVLAYQLNEQKEKDNGFITYYGKGEWADAVFLSSVLHNDCLNSWNKELVTLQRINEEREDEDET